MPKNPHADFSPVLDGYSGIGAFRFWCQTALPLTYDDSLSYYELLNKVVNYLNHTIEDLTAVESNTSALAKAYNQLQKYVNDYFDDLDVEAELRNVLDAMAEDGTLDALLDPLVENHLPGIVDEKIDGVVAEQIDGAVAGQIDESVADQLPALVDAGIPGEVSDWLEDNVDPVGSAVMVDSSLTISGAAADAKVTGDKIEELKTGLNTLDDTINGETTINYIEGKNLYANTTLGTHEIIDDPDSCISELIPVTWGWDSTTYARFYYTDIAEHSELYFIFFYDENENYLGFRGDDHERTYRAVLGRDGTAYVRFSFKRGFEGKLTESANPPTITYWKAEETVVEPGIVDKIGNLEELETENKNNLVEAINEVETDSENNYTNLNNKFDEITENGTVVDKYAYSNDELEWTDGVKYFNGNEYTTGSYLQYHFCYFDVQEGDIIETASSSFRDRCEFNNGNVVSTTNITGFKRYTVPANVDRVALTRIKTNTSNINLYRNREVLSIKETALLNNVGNALKETTNLLDDVKINIPEKIYAISGIELNIYFENIVENWKEYDWNVNCSKGMQLARGYRITPINSDAGEYTLTITIKKENSEKTVNTTLIIVPTTAGNEQTVSIIVLGDSTTYNGIAIEKLHDDFNGDVMTLRTMGTMGTAPNNHEGRSGWTLNDYFTKASITYPAGDPRGTIYNPFYNPDTETFDAEYYFMNSGIMEPDWFIINMGINDMFGYTNDTALEAQISTCIGYLNTMINSIHDVSNNIKVGICITIPPNDSQDAFGKAYACGQTRNRYKRNNTLWDNAVIAEFEGKESEGIYLIPIHVNLDTVYNMGLESIPVNSRNSKTYDSPIANGGVHPSTSGYWQVADVYMAFLKANAT